MNRTIDLTVLSKAREGDAVAFNSLVTEHWGRIFSRAFSLLGNREDAEEVAQDTFIRAQRALPRFEGGAAFGMWLYRIATNLSHNKYWYWKSRGKAASFSIDAPLCDESAASWHDVLLDEASTALLDQIDNNELLTRAMAALELLKSAHREILVLLIVKGFGYEEIAEELELSVGTVKSRISRARVALRAEMAGA